MIFDSCAFMNNNRSFNIENRNQSDFMCSTSNLSSLISAEARSIYLFSFLASNRVEFIVFRVSILFFSIVTTHNTPLSDVVHLTNAVNVDVNIVRFIYIYMYFVNGFNRSPKYVILVKFGLIPMYKMCVIYISISFR